ncbi:nitronate monooxygenase [Fusarium beomiforme]|uniref:Nitronate monooxygenase n=1 Tax=Fusarium beomiforme TaxID=44412 RepID=A0A9P5A6Z5_9HYPO|nr:nitronate monooxygenase [Fusarium beomiforme]
MSTARAVVKASKARFLSQFPWTASPFIIGAPMRVMSGPHLALAVSKAGGLGFIGPGAKPEDTSKDLATVRELLRSSPPKTLPSSFPSTDTLPVGVGFQLWNGDLESAVHAVQQHRPCAAWLFAPRRGQEELDEWTSQIREAYPGIQVWIQIGTVQESIEASKSAHRPDALVVQGSEAGGHGRATDGLGIMTLFPEIADQVRDSCISLFAAGGIADGRGVAAALSLGATGVVMGTRFLAATEARISKGYQQEIVRAKDGAQCTTRTMLYNHLRGTIGWPEQYSPRGIINQSFHDHQAGVDFEELKRRHDEAIKSGDKGWGPEGRLATYAGAAVGLIHDVQDTEAIVKGVQSEAKEVIRELSNELFVYFPFYKIPFWGYSDEVLRA